MTYLMVYITGIVAMVLMFLFNKENSRGMHWWMIPLYVIGWPVIIMAGLFNKILE